MFSFICVNTVFFFFLFLEVNESLFMRSLGEEYFKLCLAEYGSSVRMMGSNMIEFFSNIDGLHYYIIKSEKFKGQNLPSFRCEYMRNKLTLHLYTERRNLLKFYAGIVVGISKMLFNRNAVVSVSDSENLSCLHHVLTIDALDDQTASPCKICTTQETFSKSPSDNKVGVATFSKTFPFHLMFDRNFRLTQIGTALMKFVCVDRLQKKQVLFTSLFEVVRPRIEPITYSALLSRVNYTFLLRTKQLEKSSNVQVNQPLCQKTYLQTWAQRRFGSACAFS